MGIISFQSTQYEIQCDICGTEEVCHSFLKVYTVSSKRLSGQKCIG